MLTDIITKGYIMSKHMSEEFGRVRRKPLHANRLFHLIMPKEAQNNGLVMVEAH